MTPLQLLNRRGKIFRKQLLRVLKLDRLPAQLQPFVETGDIVVATAQGAPKPLVLTSHEADSFADFVARVYDTMVREAQPIHSAPLETELWNFDMLSVAETHPSRSMLESIYSDQVAYVVPREHLRPPILVRVDNQLRECTRLMYRTHLTGSAFRHMTEHPQAQGAFFAIGEVARNDNEDATHLIEFTQLEFNAPAEGQPLEVLKTSITRFVNSLGLQVTEFKPTTNPFTHPSVECALLLHGRPVEVINGGVFKPSILRRCGLRGPRVGWGCGLQRMYVLLKGLKNVKSIGE